MWGSRSQGIPQRHAGGQLGRAAAREEWALSLATPRSAVLGNQPRPTSPRSWLRTGGWVGGLG